jgi:hypothetical protein
VTYPAYQNTDVALRSLEQWRSESKKEVTNTMIMIELPEGTTEEEVRSWVDEKIQAKSELQTQTETEADPEKQTLKEDKLSRTETLLAKAEQLAPGKKEN